jgi:hypothetical protein
MRVTIGPYKDYFGPYQLAQKILFWIPKEKDEYGFPQTADRVHKFGEWLAHGSIEPEPKEGDVTLFDRERHETWIYKLLLWIDRKKKRKIKIHIDRWDTWSMDDTLAHIILPMLKQLNETKHGSPWVDDEDVPEHLRSTAAPPKENEWDTDDNHFKRWDWVLNEMIFAFNSSVDDSWEEQFHTGEGSFAFKKLENGMSEMISTGDRKYDFEGRKVYQARITNGFRLFGKYYQSLWD